MRSRRASHVSARPLNCGVRRRMFRWLNAQGVEAADGFVLQRMHRHYYHYRELDHTMQVFVEPCRGTGGRYYEQVSLSSLTRWLPPHDAAPLSGNERARIKANIS